MTVKLFRKLPVVIEAVEFVGTRLSERAIKRWMNTGDWCPADLANQTNYEISWMDIETLEGVMQASPGDWIIKGVAGEFYPCDPDIFWRTYEPVQKETDGE